MVNLDVIRILHVTESHAKVDGGVTTVVNDLTNQIKNLGVYSCIMAATDIEEPTPEAVDFVSMGLRYNSLTALFSSELKEFVRKVILEKNINIIHIHGVWRPLQIIASRLSCEMKIPFLVTSHGMLEPWLWKGKGWLGYLKKKCYFSQVARPAYQHARWIHAITPNESVNLTQLLPSNQHVVIPNAVDLPAFREWAVGRNEKTLFFLGRINPKKGVKLLLIAFKESGLASSWKLVIAGPEEIPEYAEELRHFVKKNGLETSVKFVGPVFGEQKEQWFRRSWVTIVPSYSEVVGIVNLEASSLGCPTITTISTGLSDWEEGGGMLINPDVSELVSALKSVSLWGAEERQRRAKSSYDLVKNKYSWESVGRKWLGLYIGMHKEK